ncbi:MAG: cupin domain-containing protein [Solirubrobacteraceae bacterium]|jgi:mannose-6-phosphate isomerase-like protein (cupin superfamily)
MADYTVKRFDEMEPILDGVFRRARAELGVTSFGMQVLQMPEGADFYPNHNHAHDGQEEVYVILDGSADFDIEGERVHVEPETAVRIAPHTKRQIRPGAGGVRILALGGVPGGVYEPPGFSELGGPVPVPDQD